MELVKTSGLKKYYRTGEICVKALDQVNLSVEEGEFIAVVGPSGCGIRIADGYYSDFAVGGTGKRSPITECLTCIEYFYA